MLKLLIKNNNIRKLKNIYKFGKILSANNMKRILFTFFLFISIYSFSQEDQILKKNILNMDYFSFGVKINTNGWGVDFRRSYAMDYRRKRMYEVGLNFIKHPKEQRISTLMSMRSFVYGKLNWCADLKGGIGIQKMFFDKKEIGTVEVRAYAFGGFDLALLKPVYYLVIVDGQGTTEYQKYNVSMQPAYIERQAPFTKGLTELTLNPGLYLKLGTSFEHSKRVKNVRSLEFGIESYLFLKSLKIMAEVKNPNLIVSLFMSYRFGSVVQKKKSKQAEL